MTRLIFALVLACGLSACAFGRQHALHTARPRLEEAADKGAWVALAVHDQRKEIISGEKEPDFVGLSRGGYGNPFDVTTENDGPLAQNVAESMKNGLQAAGFRATVVLVAHSRSPAQVHSKLSAVGASRLLLVRIDRWKSDAYMTTGLDFDLTAAVMDREGNVLGRAVQHGHDAIGGAGSSGDRGAVQALETKLELLLNSPKIQSALGQAPPAIAEAHAPRR